MKSQLFAMMISLICATLGAPACSDSRTDQAAIEAEVQEKQRVDSEGKAFRRFCEQDAARREPRPGYSANDEIESCISTMQAMSAQTDREAKARRAQKDLEIEAIREASCQIDPTIGYC